MHYDLFQVFQRPPMGSSISSDATVVPSLLILAHRFEDEIVKLDDVRVLSHENLSKCISL